MELLSRQLGLDNPQLHTDEYTPVVTELSWLIFPCKIIPPYRRRYIQMHFMIGMLCVLIKISLKFIPNVRINNNPASF